MTTIKTLLLEFQCPWLPPYQTTRQVFHVGKDRCASITFSTTFTDSIELMFSDTGNQKYLIKERDIAGIILEDETAVEPVVAPKKKANAGKA